MNQRDVRQGKPLYLYHSQKIKIFLLQMRKRMRDDKYKPHLIFFPTPNQHIIDGRLYPTLLYWPDREQLRQSLPACFGNTFLKCVLIINCFEIFIEKQSSLKAGAETYSNYKSHNTIKCLIGITP